MTKDSIGILYDLFADLLAYPASSITQKAEECLSQLQESQPDAASALEKFLHGLQHHPLEKMKELYTTTFDMQPVCYPYLGYQFGYSAVQELPGHVAVVLRYLGLDSTNRQNDFCQALINEGLIPAMEKMLKVFGEGSENPYFGLLSALHLFLVNTPEKELSHA